MSEMTELIVLLMSPITAFAGFLFVEELRRPPEAGTKPRASNVIDLQVA